jgi:hypothetical protein
VFLDQFKLSGPPTIEANQGWVSGEAVNEWATLALEALEDKLALLNKSHYGQLNEYELLLYSNTHLPDIELDNGIAALSRLFSQKHGANKFPRLFGALSVIYGNEIRLRALRLRNAA